VDSITHLLSGALIGEAIAGKQLKKRAMLWGALAQTLPDLDVLAGFWLPTSQNLLAHRGFTHSFLFAATAAPLLAWVATRLQRKITMSYSRWLALFGVELLVHILLDSLTTYGTGWFEPFSHYRVSFDTQFVADPFYTIWLFIPWIVLMFLRKDRPARKGWTRFGLISSTLYILLCMVNKSVINHRVNEDFTQMQIHPSRVMTTPTPLNNLLWYTVAEMDKGYFIGYHSVFDRPGKPQYHFLARNDSLIAPYMQDEDLLRLLRFSNGYYIIEPNSGKLLFNDLRFGQAGGWDNPEAPFVFNYFLKDTGDNSLVVQRGRFEEVRKDAFRSLVNRIMGKK